VCEHSMEKWADLLFVGQPRPDQIKVERYEKYNNSGN
jgi:hypothetical protein